MAKPAKSITPEPESYGTGSGGVAQGATYSTTYLDREIKGVPVSIDELEDFKSGSIEEFGQFIFGNFLISGAFWLGLERAITTASFWHDLLFWICVVCVIAGSVISLFGFRQLRRRKQRIDRIIASAKARAGQV